MNSTTTMPLDSTVSENCTISGMYHGAVYFPLIKHDVYMIVILSVAYSIIFISALIGNIMVIIVVVRNPWMQNVTNYFVVNLAVADILVAIFCIPWTLLDNIYTGWRFGAFLCKMTPYMQQVCVSASVTTLAVIAIDRYLAICNTWQTAISKLSSRVIIFFVWTSALVVAVPKMIFYEQFERNYGFQTIPLCNEIWPQFDLQRSYFVICLFVLCYTLPLTIIVICYLSITIRVWKRRAPGIANNSKIIQKSKMKVVKMFAIVVSLFVLSWLPLYALFLKLYFSPPDIDSQEFNIIFRIIVPLFQWLGLSNSCINPLIYCKFSKKYRHGFKNVVKCQTGHLNLQRGATRSATTNDSSKLVQTDSVSSTTSNRRHIRVFNNSPARQLSVLYSNGHFTVTFHKDGE